jgi:hypothetical protein
MNTVRSADGTVIAYDNIGSGRRNEEGHGRDERGEA